jgi:LysM repeat protein
MRWRVLALISLGANVALLLAWLGPRSNGGGFPRAEALAQANEHSTKTNVVVRRQFFTWRELESADYPTYIANLRYIGCPEQTIRDIIIADVNAMFSRRRALELISPEQQWWRSEPDPELVIAANEKAAALEEERRDLLRRLLGENWESGDMLSLPRPTRPGIILDGPVLGSLPTETKQALQEIHARSQERVEMYLQSRLREGKTADPAELVKLRQQTRDELAGILAPAHLEEYLLRFSQTAEELRAELGQLEFFDASPDEFRAIFRATDTLDQRLQSITGTDYNSQQARRALEEQRENAIRTALGSRRYEDYRNLQDPLYRDAVETARATGRPEAAAMLYQINLAAEQERASVTSNTNLTSSQNALALKQIELEELTANTIATDQATLPEGPPPLPPAAPRRTYTVHPNDNLSVIALIYGVPVNAIRQANPNVNFRQLRPGDVLVIPQRLQPELGGP